MKVKRKGYLTQFKKRRESLIFVHIAKESEFQELEIHIKERLGIFICYLLKSVV